jgi:threonine aldolase
VEANAVFVRIRENVMSALRARGWAFYKFIEPDIYRLMCSWAASDSDIADLIADLKA